MTREARRRQDLERALAVHEREFREQLVRVEPEPGDEFFPDLPVGLELLIDQRQALTDFRAVLNRHRPKYVRPSDTSGTFTDLGGYLDLSVPHAGCPSVMIKLIFGDGYLSLTWPCGEEHDGWDWSPLLANAVDALVSGRNRQVLYL